MKEHIIQRLVFEGLPQGSIYWHLKQVKEYAVSGAPILYSYENFAILSGNDLCTPVLIINITQF